MFHLAFFTEDEIQDKQNFMKKKLNWGCSNKDIKAILKGCIEQRELAKYEDIYKIAKNAIDVIEKKT